MGFMFLVVICYTVASIGDKTAVTKYKLNGNELTFLMAASISVYLMLYLPFDSRLMTISWQSITSVIFITISKLLEFQLAAIVLMEMSAFELKAWIGTTLFISYATDLITGTSQFNSETWIKFCFIAVTATGLFLITKSGSRNIKYSKIIFPLLGYLLSKYSYGLAVNLSKEYISPTISLFTSLLILSAILAPKVKPLNLFRQKTAGALYYVGTKIPNFIGLICENIVASHSMTNYSFIQPMILIVLFVLNFFNRCECSKLNIVGGIVCILGIVGFMIF